MTQMRALAAVILFAACSAPASAPPPAPATEPSVGVREPAAAYGTPVPAPPPPPAPATLPFCEGASGNDDPVRLCPEGAVLRLDGAIGPADAAAIVAQVRDDMTWVRRELGWTPLRAVPIDVYATRARYAAGLAAVFGYSAATAAFVADNSVALFEPSLVRIAVSWDDLRDRRPIAAIRHELTHVATQDVCAPRCDLVPAWLNEGEARLAEALIPGAEWRMLRVRYEAASMAATQTLLPLGRLVTQAQWNALADWDGYYKYQQAARTVDLLRQDLGDDAIARLYRLLRRGEDVATAYAHLAGRSFEEFTAGLPARMLDGASAPGVATAAPGTDGEGVAVVVYGLPDGARATLVLPGRTGAVEDLLVSPQGAAFVSLGANDPPGTYTVRVSGGASFERTFSKRGGRAPNAADR